MAGSDGRQCALASQRHWLAISIVLFGSTPMRLHGLENFLSGSKLADEYEHGNFEGWPVLEFGSGTARLMVEGCLVRLDGDLKDLACALPVCGTLL